MSDSFDIVPTPWYQSEILALPDEDQERIERKLSDFRAQGWTAAAAKGTVKHLRDGIHELRILGTGASYRILFFLVPGRSPRVVVLTACAAKSVMKKRQRLEAEVERARTRRAAWQQQQQKRGNDDR
jgi:putative component of toxin-antitoxin plasmid stabilization module